MIINSETTLQQACVKWFDRNVSPTQAFLYAVPNGGSRHKAEAVNLKKEGLKAGVADLVLMLAGGSTIYIEMKYGKNTQSKPQVKFEQIAKGLGFNYYIIRSLKEFKIVVGYFVPHVPF